MTKQKAKILKDTPKKRAFWESIRIASNQVVRKFGTQKTPRWLTDNYSCGTKLEDTNE